MSDIQAIADRVEIEALRGEFADAVMMNDHDRLASLFTSDGAVRIPLGNIEAAGREQIRALGERRQALADYFVYHDRYQRTPDCWKFTERVAEFRYLDTTPLAGSAGAVRSGEATAEAVAAL